jgi:hypothetical protein
LNYGTQGYLVHLVFLVHLVCLVYLVCLVCVSLSGSQAVPASSFEFCFTGGVDECGLKSADEKAAGGYGPD